MKTHKCKYCNREFKSGRALGGHIIRCTKNPNTTAAKNSGKTLSKRYKSGKIKPTHLGKPLSKYHKQSISDSMKKAHAEGRAWNIGKSRWYNEPSYPEKFFAEVIANEFEDKNYESEYNVGIYSIDFAWPHLKLAIEIDGDQHQRFEEVKERDKRKDALLKKEGWKVLRIVWKDMYNDSKQWIKIAKEFVVVEASR